jgi:hypothetical protein
MNMEPDRIVIRILEMLATQIRELLPYAQWLAVVMGVNSALPERLLSVF